ncbi:hypothetical protein GEMRC1_001084 [Eukaryota sp. GEM-RC1]
MEEHILLTSTGLSVELPLVYDWRATKFDNPIWKVTKVKDFDTFTQKGGFGSAACGKFVDITHCTRWKKEHISLCQSLKNTEELVAIQASDARIEERKKMKKEAVRVEVSTIDALVSPTSKTPIPKGQRLLKNSIPTKSITGIIGKK